ncbi:MAG: hypothetical protein KF842_06870 [Caulobacter sp.]|nr:hypothetical protein [Caulobacter sp.]
MSWDAGQVPNKLIHWSSAEDALLRRALSDGRPDPVGRTARATGRSENSVRSRMRLLGLKPPGAPAIVPTIDKPPRPWRGRGAPALSRVGERAGVETLKPITGARLRYATWFHRAHWPVEEIAALFDVDAGDLQRALDSGRVLSVGESVH